MAASISSHERVGVRDEDAAPRPPAAPQAGWPSDPGSAATTGENPPPAGGFETVQLLTPAGDVVHHERYSPWVEHLGVADLQGMYQDMVKVRRFDQEATALQRQGELGLWAPSLGQEAAQIGSGRALASRDYVFPSYREHGVALTRGMDLGQILHLFRGQDHGGWDPAAHNFHPNTHVNMSQSTNDVIPTAFRIALLDMLGPTADALEGLAASFARKADEFAGILKVGRTHLQDAVPMYLGQEFGAYARVTRRHAERLRAASAALAVVNLGATAVGTGLNAPPEYARRAVELLREWTGHPLEQAEDLVDATQNVDAPVAVSGELRAAALSLSKIASDLRLMASGPRAGLGELALPPVQPGS